MGCCQSDAVKTVESSRAPSEVPKNVHHSVVHHGTSQEPVVLGGKETKLEGENGDSSLSAATQRLSSTQSGTHGRLGKATISPIPLFVFKTVHEVDGKSDKVFLNVYAHKKVEKDHLLIHNKELVQDKKGESCYAYGVVLSDEAGQKCLSDESYKLWTSEQVTNVLNIVYSATIDVTKIKFPVMKKGFVGDTIPFFSLEEDLVLIKNPVLLSMKKEGKSEEKRRSSVGGSVMHSLFGGLMPSSSPAPPPPPAATAAVKHDAVATDVDSKAEAEEKVESSPHPSSVAHPTSSHSTTASAPSATTVSAPAAGKVVTTTAAVPVAVISLTASTTVTAGTKSGGHPSGTGVIIAPTSPSTVPASAAVVPITSSGDASKAATESAVMAPAPSVGLPPLAPGHVYRQSSPKPIDDLHPTLSISQVAVPRRLTGWMKKQGHFAKTWKMRYFVLDRGMLTYFVDEKLSPPYGTDMKGQLCLAGYREQSLMSDSVTTSVQEGFDRANTYTSAAEETFIEGSSTLQIQLQYYPNIVSPEVVDELNKLFGRGAPEQSHKEFLMVCQSLDAKEAWLAALEAHTSYIETIALKFRQDMENNKTTSLTSNNLTGSGAPSPTTREDRSYSISSAISSFSRRGSMNNSNNSINSGRPKVSRASRQASITLSAQKWAIFLNRNEKMVLAGLVEKPNPVGYRYMRNLLLVKYEAPEGSGDQGPIACRKRLIYIDSNSYEKKGEILWLEDARTVRPTITSKDDYFDVVESNGKSYRFYPKDDLSVAHWIAEINGLPPV